MMSDLPTPPEMEELFLQKYGDPETTGWAPRNRRRFGYYLPADIYEATVARHVRVGCRWLAFLTRLILAAFDKERLAPSAHKYVKDVFHRIRYLQCGTFSF